MPHFKSYARVCEYMDNLGLFSMDMGLGRMESFWERRGAPGVPAVHVVGTNGKGSTSTFLESVARENGVRTGLFTSPHLVTPRERVRICGRMLESEDWTRLANMVLATPGGADLTYFEFQTCLAMLAFMDAGVDLAIMEAGLGGRYDATNVFTPGLTLFTPVGLDHESVLGSTLEAIARDKAGAMHAGGTAITGPQEPEALAVLEEQARALGAPLLHASDLIGLVPGTLGLRGPHQQDNARLALSGWQIAAEMFGRDSDPEAVAAGLAQAFIPGRFHRVRPDRLPDIVLDGAHNLHAFKALAHTLEQEGVRPQAVVFACMADKDISSMVPLLRSMSDGPILCPAMPWERATRPVDLVKVLGGKAEATDGMATALQRVADLPGPVLVCGSLYLLAAFYELYPEFLSRNSR